jgi:hypothetical protein
MVLARIEADAACGRTGDELTPVFEAPLPYRFGSAVDAYVALSSEVTDHAARIEETCRDDGYFEARIREPILVREGNELSVRFHVEEGRRFTVQRVTISIAGTDGLLELEPGAFPWMRTRHGRAYRREDALADARALADAVAAFGAEVADAGLGRSENEDAATVDVHFVVALNGPLPSTPATGRGRGRRESSQRSR